MNAADYTDDPVLVELVEAARAAVIGQTITNIGAPTCWTCAGELGSDEWCPTCRLARALAAYDAEAECPRD